MLEVRLFATFEIRRDGTPVVLRSRIAQSLFAYLILNSGVAHRREKLAGLFWPDSSEVRARASLRNELWRIRKAFGYHREGHPILTDGLTVTFCVAPTGWLDVWELTRLTENATVSELLAGLSAYRGELLPGFYDEWVVLERQYLQAIFEGGMSRLLHLLEMEKRWGEAVDWAERWIALGQSPEGAYRSLMVAHAALHDRTKAMAAYYRYARAFQQLGLEPSAEIRALRDTDRFTP